METLATKQIEMLYKRHHNRLLLQAHSLLGNDEEANDVVSDVFAELLAKGKLLDEQQAESYLTVCVRNKCLNIIEHRRVEKEAVTKMPAETEVTIYEDPPYDEVVSYANTHLSPKEHKIIEQHFFHHKKYGEIAHEMGISRFAVYKHMIHGLSRLRKHFSKFYLIIVLIVLSAMAYAFFLHLRQSSHQKAPTPAPIEQTAPEASPTTIHYEDATLEQILIDISAHHKVGLSFQSDDARQLRLHYDWHQAESLSNIVGTLNAFESIDIELQQNTICVK